MSSVTELFDLIQHPESATSVAADRWATEIEEHPYFALGRAAAYLAAKNSGRPLNNDALFLSSLSFSSRDRLKALLHGHIPDFPLPALSSEAFQAQPEKAQANFSSPEIAVESPIKEEGLDAVHVTAPNEPESFEEAIAISSSIQVENIEVAEPAEEESTTQTDFVSGTAWTFSESTDETTAYDENETLHQSPINEVLDEAIPEVEHKEPVIEASEIIASEIKQEEKSTPEIKPEANPSSSQDEIPENEKGMSLADRIMAHLQEVGENRKKYLDHMVEADSSTNLEEQASPSQALEEAPAQVVNTENPTIDHFQAELIDKFIEADPKINISIPPAGDVELVDLAKGSYDIEPEMVTETLANLFIKQGKPEKAREVYMKLMAQNPDKADYFASRLLENGL